MKQLFQLLASGWSTCNELNPLLPFGGSAGVESFTGLLALLLLLQRLTAFIILLVLRLERDVVGVVTNGPLFVSMFCLRSMLLKISVPLPRLPERSQSCNNLLFPGP